MPTRNKTEKQRDDSGVLRDQWLKVLGDLTSNVKSWAEELDWSTRQIAKRMKDSRLGSYDAPALLMQKETIRVLLDPVRGSRPARMALSTST